jgi:mono/diheme cytochrome c family protein
MNRMLRTLLPGLVLANSVVASIAAVAAAEPAKLPPPAERKVDYLADIQPLLKKNCYSCHGSERREGGLRLDQRQRALDGGDSGREIIAGKSADSRLVKLVAGIDEEFGVMPPDGKGKPLNAAEIGLIRAWIDQGATWPDDAALADAAKRHWSLQPIVRAAPPAVRDKSWTRSPIDAFILARLERDRLAPSPPAERATLLRRAYLDLTGLLPSPDDIDQFANDSRPDATERLVDRLLASPHFGERWGRHWLDLARYADSDGYEKDRPRPFAWRYRDWVIAALNADLPYDQFTTEQLAGDLLPCATLAQRTASGLHRNTLHNTEGGIDPEEDRVKKTVDRTNTLGTIWLGLTVGCAQCHTHKYDPLTQREYYSLYAFFNNLDEADIEAPTPEQAEKLAADRQVHTVEMAKLREALTTYERDKLGAAQAQWETKAAASPVVWQTLDLISLTSKYGASFAKQPDGSTLVSGENKVSDVYTLETTAQSGKLTAIRLEVLPEKSLPKSGPGRNANGNFVLATFRVTAAPISGNDTNAPPLAIAFISARADHSQAKFSPELAINEDPADGWAISPQFGKRHVAVFEAKEPLGFDGGTRLTITLDQAYGKEAPHNIGCFRLSVATSPPPVPLEGIPANVAQALAVSKTDRSAEQAKSINTFYRTIDAEYVRLAKEVTDHEAKAPKLPEDQKAQSVSQHGEPRVTNVLLRGDFLSPGDAVEPGTIAVLPPLAARGTTPDRLDLARWLVDPAQPLTSRVAVNRVWQQMFGRGLVPTSDDFGKQGELPSHPELLDWLASEYVADGWSLKELIRTIACSRVYQQSSVPRHELTNADPENVLLARQSRRRVESEIIRDLSLAASGLLTERIGGPSVRPPQPAEYAGLTYAGSAKWVESQGADRYRRGLYTFFQRTSPYPMLMTFDSPDSNECTVRRQTSNTPLQALTIWNDPAFFEASQSLARRVVREVPGMGEPRDIVRRRAGHAFALCITRQPSEAELTDLVVLFDDQVRLTLQDEAAAKQIAGPEPLPEGTTAAELAAWIGVSRTVLNLDEFITRE